MKKLSSLIIYLLTALTIYADVSLELSVSDNNLFIGESTTVTVVVNGTIDELPLPEFIEPKNLNIEFITSSQNSAYSTKRINGKATTRVFLTRTFVFKATPTTAGISQVKKITYNGKQGSAIHNGFSLSVSDPDKIKSARISLSSPDKQFITDTPFHINLKIALRALPSPHEDVEPIFSEQPIKITASYLDFPQQDGIKSLPAEQILSPYIGNGRDSAFIINNYVRQDRLSFLIGNSFNDPPIHFRLPPQKEEIDGTNWWVYTLPVEYTATKEGTYTFGTATISGTLIVGADKYNRAKTERIYKTTPPLTITVTPPPLDDRPESYIGVAGTSLNLKAKLDTSTCKVGDPVTLTIDVTGKVNPLNLRAPTLALTPEEKKSFRLYDDTIESDTIKDGKRFSWKLRPLQSGTLEIPAIKASYYNTQEGKYITEATAPIPLQVSATTQIAAESNSEETEEESEIIPDAIYHTGSTANPKLTALSLWLLPVLWLLAVSTKLGIAAYKHLKEKKKYGRIASREMKKLHSTIQQVEKNPETAIQNAATNARHFIGAMLTNENRSLTSSELKTMLADKIADTDYLTKLHTAITLLEELPYRKDGIPTNLKEILIETETILKLLPDNLNRSKKEERRKGSKTALISLLFALTASISSAEELSFSTSPNRFEWERAQQAIYTAQSKEDFKHAADLYYSMATNGVQNGTLYYNLGTALLLSGEPKAACEAFDIAARWLGHPPELKYNRALATKEINGTEQLPPERYLLFWHYQLSLPQRVNVAVIIWNLTWLLALLCVIKVLRKKLRIPLILSAIILIAFAVSILITYHQTQSIAKLDTLENKIATPELQNESAEIAEEITQEQSTEVAE